MSQLNQLKQQVSNVADAAKKTGSALAQFEKQLSKQSQQVTAAIGGSSQGKDRQVISAIQSASKAVKEAQSALQNAARVAQQYAQSL